MLWNTYYNELQILKHKGIILPTIPDFASNNAHAFYLICNNLKERDALIQHLKTDNIIAVFHYLSLHDSLYFKEKHDGRILLNADKFSDCLVRLPLYFELTQKDITDIIVPLVKSFF
jgi:dTDP-4-amino-4,6-dideoxygalactose transaminase